MSANELIRRLMVKGSIFTVFTYYLLKKAVTKIHCRLQYYTGKYIVVWALLKALIGGCVNNLSSLSVGESDLLIKC